jgi:hypothetical protein
MKRKPIIKVCFAKLTEAWFRLSEEKLEELEGKAGKKFEEVGGKAIVKCPSYMSNEEWNSFGVEEYPDIEAVQKFAEFLLELEWSMHIESKTYLGTRVEAS